MGHIVELGSKAHLGQGITVPYKGYIRNTHKLYDTYSGGSRNFFRVVIKKLKLYKIQ